MDELIGLIATVILVVTLGIPARQIGHHYSVNNCRIFQDETGYETKFVDYHFFKWDCLAQTKTGKWVSKDNLREMD